MSKSDNDSANGRHRTHWVCMCQCGETIVASQDNLLGGRTKSCGCFRKETASKRNTTHGESKTKLYAVWQQMKNRCNKPNTTYYEYYGGRGISVCSEWDQHYEAFRDWALANGYDDGLMIDRVDSDGNYEPSNCRWVTGVAQANNRRSNRLYTYCGETHNVTEWAKIVNINPKTLFNRLYSGWSFEKAITT